MAEWDSNFDLFLKISHHASHIYSTCLLILCIIESIYTSCFIHDIKLYIYINNDNIEHKRICYVRLFKPILWVRSVWMNIIYQYSQAY